MRGGPSEAALCACARGHDRDTGLEGSKESAGLVCGSYGCAGCLIVAGSHRSVRIVGQPRPVLSAFAVGSDGSISASVESMDTSGEKKSRASTAERVYRPSSTRR